MGQFVRGWGAVIAVAGLFIAGQMFSPFKKFVWSAAAIVAIIAAWDSWK